MTGAAVAEAVIYGDGVLDAATEFFNEEAAETPPLSDHKKALEIVHDKVGKLPKGKPGKFGSPQAGTPAKGYRLDPPHTGVAEGGAESKFHINWWDYTKGKRGRGGAKRRGTYWRLV